MFTVKSLDTNYSEIPTGYIDDTTFAAFVSEYALEIVDSKTIRAEWGNGEGYDTFEIEFDGQNPIETLSAVMTASEAEEEYGLATGTIRQAANRNQIPARKSGGTWLVLRSDMDTRYVKKVLEL